MAEFAHKAWRPLRAKIALYGTLVILGVLTVMIFAGGRLSDPIRDYLRAVFTSAR